MEDSELAGIVLNLINKGYSDHDTLRYCDDMYSAESDDEDRASELLDEALNIGTAAFEKKYIESKEKEV